MYLSIFLFVENKFYFFFFFVPNFSHIAAAYQRFALSRFYAVKLWDSFVVLLFKINVTVNNY